MIVFVPGIMGVELVDSRDGRSIWGKFAQCDQDGSQVCEIALPYAQDRPVRDSPHGVHFNGADHLSRPGDPEFLEQVLDLLLEASDPPAP